MWIVKLTHIHVTWKLVGDIHPAGEIHFHWTLGVLYSFMRFLSGFLFCFCLCMCVCVCARAKGQYWQAHSDARGHVLRQQSLPGKTYTHSPNSLWQTAIQLQYRRASVFYTVGVQCCPPIVRYPTDSTQCSSMKARHQQVITGPTSTTMPTSAGWSTMILASQSHRGRSWSETHSGAWLMQVPTAWCT